MGRPRKKDKERLGYILSVMESKNDAERWFSVRIKQSLLDEFDEYCAKDNVTRSDVVRVLMLDYIKARQKGNKRFPYLAKRVLRVTNRYSYIRKGPKRSGRKIRSEEIFEES